MKYLVLALLSLSVQANAAQNNYSVTCTCQGVSRTCSGTSMATVTCEACCPEGPLAPTTAGSSKLVPLGGAKNGALVQPAAKLNATRIGL